MSVIPAIDAWCNPFDERGIRTIFIDNGYAETLRARPNFVAPDFATAVGIVLAG